MDDRLTDNGAQAGHAVAKPFRHPAAVKREIRAASPLWHQVHAPGTDVVAPAHWSAPAPNSGNSSALGLGVSAKFDTVTPTRRTPLVRGNSGRTSSTPA